MRLFKKETNVSSSTRRSRSAPLMVEQLEPRTLLSAATQAVASAIVHSTENLGDFVVSEYFRFLRRSPDLAGFQGWLARLETGTAPGVVEAGFVSSREYLADFGNNPAVWLTALYQDLLGRAPDAMGFNGWLNALASGMSPRQVASAFTSGTERQSIVISEDYFSFLGRAPEPGAVGGWLSFERQGHNRADVATQILASNEFFADHGNIPSTFIIGVFESVLQRTPTMAELDHFLSVFNGHTASGSSMPAMFPMGAGGKLAGLM